MGHLSTLYKITSISWKYFSNEPLIITWTINKKTFQNCEFHFSSIKHHFELKLTKKYKVQELIITRELEIGTRANQVSTLHRRGTTCWGSYFSSIRSLIELFGITRILLSNIYENRPNSQFYDMPSNIIFLWYLLTLSLSYLWWTKLWELLIFFPNASKIRLRYYKCLKFCFTCKISTSKFEEWRLGWFIWKFGIFLWTI
jgi:hypothetical protein